MFVIGLDIGSTTTKATILNEEKKILSYEIVPTGSNMLEAEKQVFDSVLKKANLKRNQISNIISSGYGRERSQFAVSQITEIKAMAIGADYLYPGVKTLIDVGGQDSKAILISKKTGKVIDFQMNDKCAAGTGRFLEVMAHALEVPLDDIGKLALQSNQPASISSTCTVFAESEVISLFARGASKKDIASGIHKSIARRVAGMAKRIGVAPLLVFCGGVAKNVAVKSFLEEELGYEIVTPNQPQLTGAIGAALIAQEHNGN